MAFMELTAGLLTGVDEMDQQHRRLVELINQLHEAMKSGKGAEQSQVILKSLVDYTNSHFSREEAMLRRHNWPGLTRHLTLHQDLLRQLNQFITAFNKTQRVSSIELSDFLRDWLYKHIQQEDLQYGKDLKA
jgi:hemerythrin-like metal-binding protein